MKTILLTGATGFLGSRTLERLVELPDVKRVIATGRSIKQTHFIDHPKAEYRLGDLTDANFVDSLVEGADIVINTAALSSPWGKEGDFKVANVNTQSNVIEAALKYGVDRFIYVSTPSLYFKMQDQFNIKEDDPLPAPFVNAYASTKREAELLLQASGLPYVMFRPRALIGRGDTVIMPRLLRAYNEGRLKIIGDGKNLVDMTPVSNVVDAIILALTVTGEGLNQTYNISNGSPVSLWDAINKVFIRLGKKPLTQKVPFPIIRTIAQVMEWKAKWTNYNEPPLTVYSVAAMAKSFSLDITKARNLLGYEPRMTTEEAMDNFVAWYLDQ